MRSFLFFVIACCLFGATPWLWLSCWLITFECSDILGIFQSTFSLNLAFCAIVLIDRLEALAHYSQRRRKQCIWKFALVSFHDVNYQPEISMLMPNITGRFHDELSGSKIPNILLICPYSHRRTYIKLWPSDAICRHRTTSTLVWVMAWWSMAPSHYLNQCWPVIDND